MGSHDPPPSSSESHTWPGSPTWYKSFQLPLKAPSDRTLAFPFTLPGCMLWAGEGAGSLILDDQ